MLRKILVTALLLGTAPAIAQTSPQPATTPSTPARNPNRVICEDIGETGSRLAKNRLCMTAAQWAEQRRLTRDEIDSAQRWKGGGN